MISPKGETAAGQANTWPAFIFPIDNRSQLTTIKDMETLISKAQTYTNAELIAGIKLIGGKAITDAAEEMVLSALIEVCVDRLIESGKTGDEAADYVDGLLGQ